MEAKNTELTTQLAAEKSKSKSGKSEAKVCITVTLSHHNRYSLTPSPLLSNTTTVTL
jgi:hypothetical protein